MKSTINGVKPHAAACANTGAGTRGRRPSAPVVAIVLSAILIGPAAGCRAPGRTAERPAAPGGIRAIWVTRWDYKSRHDITRIMENARAAGFNTVMFQVRGNGTVCYRSKLEPWADELGGRYPGYDPLGVAITEARRRGISLHAWVNVMPGWRDDAPPTNARQLYNARPEWFWHDERGRRQPLGWYVSLNPCYPEVRRYLVDVMREIVCGYDVDGLHLDYIRFPNEWNSAYVAGAQVPDYPRDPRTLALFRRETGHSPESSRRQWDQWRTNQVTALLSAIRAMMNKTKPQAALSAAVGAEPDEARRRHFQDVKHWLTLGLLDTVYPMNYSADLQAFESRVYTWSNVRAAVPVVMGIMFDGREGSLVLRQIDIARRGGAHVAAFAYNSLFERLDSRGQPIMDEQSKSRASLRRRVIPYIRRLAVSPSADPGRRG